ncbi:MAG: bifunctional diaminohydroxyphosphoribosylaminopyrimidine deaminase/5-amino-6-(5-phosphoribosylamino)uracil reductase RibD [Deltaproteobacteria bacterium]|nr:bifunctional diaminohydroxyphosphoribosylaminopyrimidine deaminase/5-amino-6-(5-phosphoribosylamino)uracil reductase RibD [Deltaproteobacteria bacterium]
MTPDEVLMAQAIELARCAKPSPNPRVGSLFVRDGEIIGKGFHKRAGSAHAEIAALESAGERAKGATVYVTLEPCNHHGRTAPCTEALIAAQVARVVIGVADPNPNVLGRGTDRLREAGIEVVMGVSQRECAELIASWRTFVLRGTPRVIVKVGMTLDGRIATRLRESKWITGPEARHDGHLLRARADAVLVGVGTVLADDPMLTPRNVDIVGALPVRVVLDTFLRTPTSSVLAKTAMEAPVWILHGKEAPRDQVIALRAMGVETLEVRCSEDRVDPAEALVVLGRRGITELLVEGGGEVHGTFLDARLGDELVAYIAPKLFGGRDAFAAFGGTGIGRLSEAHLLANLQAQMIGSDLKVTAEFTDVHRDYHSDR